MLDCLVFCPLPAITLAVVIFLYAPALVDSPSCTIAGLSLLALLDVEVVRASYPCYFLVAPSSFDGTQNPVPLCTVPSLNFSHFNPVSVPVSIRICQDKVHMDFGEEQSGSGPQGGRTGFIWREGVGETLGWKGQ